MFTATMIYQLVEEGKLKLTDRLDNSIRRYRTPPKLPLSRYWRIAAAYQVRVWNSILLRSD